MEDQPERKAVIALKNPKNENQNTTTPINPVLSSTNDDATTSYRGNIIKNNNNSPEAFAEAVNNNTQLVSFGDHKNSDPDDEKYFKMFPPGYKFKPYDEELVVDYLQKKIVQEPLPPNRIREVTLYEYNPDDLTALYSPAGEKEWYFFTPRNRKYPNGDRPDRAAGGGYWKATGADKLVKKNGNIVGYRKALVFYRGRPPRGDKTDWIMHEFRVNAPSRSKGDMKLDDYVLCRIYKKFDRSSKKNPAIKESIKESSPLPTASYNHGSEIGHYFNPPLSPASAAATFPYSYPYPYPYNQVHESYELLPYDQYLDYEDSDPTHFLEHALSPKYPFTAGSFQDGSFSGFMNLDQSSLDIPDNYKDQI